MLKFFIAFYAIVIAFAVVINVGIGGQESAVGLQQLSNSELGLSQLN